MTSIESLFKSLWKLCGPQQPQVESLDTITPLLRKYLKELESEDEEGSNSLRLMSPAPAQPEQDSSINQLMLSCLKSGSPHSTPEYTTDLHPPFPTVNEVEEQSYLFSVEETLSNGSSRFDWDNFDFEAYLSELDWEELNTIFQPPLLSHIQQAIETWKLYDKKNLPVTPDQFSDFFFPNTDHKLLVETMESSVWRIQSSAPKRKDQILHLNLPVQFQNNEQSHAIDTRRLIWDATYRGGSWNEIILNIAQHDIHFVCAWVDSPYCCFRKLSRQDVVDIYQNPLKFLHNNLKLILIATIRPHVSDLQSLESLIINNPHFTLKEIQSIAKQLLKALEILHQFDIVHRKIAPNNIQISNGKLYLSGFSASQSTRDPSETYVIETPQYLAPELTIDQTYTKSADLYSVAAILFELATQTPFIEASNIQEFANVYIQYAQIDQTLEADKRLDKVDEELGDLIKKLGKSDPNNRISAKEALRHPFLSKSC